jgi:hypothetical protein
MLDVYVVQQNQGAEFDLIFLAALDASHNALERAATGMVHAVSVVEFLRPVNADAEQKLVVVKEPAPCIVEQDAIGL